MRLTARGKITTFARADERLFEELISRCNFAKNRCFFGTWCREPPRARRCCDLERAQDRARTRSWTRWVSSQEINAFLASTMSCVHRADPPSGAGGWKRQIWSLINARFVTPADCVDIKINNELSNFYCVLIHTAVRTRIHTLYTNVRKYEASKRT